MEHAGVLAPAVIIFIALNLAQRLILSGWNWELLEPWGGNTPISSSNIPAIIVTIVAAAIIQGWLALGFTRMTLDIHAGGKPRLPVLFSQGHYLINYILAGLMVGLGVLAGLLLLIVPGIVLAIRWSMFPYLIVDRGVGPVEAIKASWQMTRGSSWRLLLFLILIGVLNLLGALFFQVGTIITLPLTTLATVYIYHILSFDHHPQIT